MLDDDTGHGMIIIPDWNDKKQKEESCAEASHNMAYKTI